MSKREINNLGIIIKKEALMKSECSSSNKTSNMKKIIVKLQRDMNP